jgi:hypothetical protein
MQPVCEFENSHPAAQGQEGRDRVSRSCPSFFRSLNASGLSGLHSGADCVPNDDACSGNGCDGCVRMPKFATFDRRVKSQ